MDVIIVDKQDQVLGYKPVEELTGDDLFRVTGLWLTNSQGQALMAQRQLNKSSDPGKWGPAVAGTVEKGESYEQNIYKEAEEEIGLSGIKFSLGPKIINDASAHPFFVQWFLATIDWPIERFVLQSEEVKAVEWIDKDELVKQIKTNPTKFIAGSEKVWAEFLV